MKHYILTDVSANVIAVYIQFGWQDDVCSERVLDRTYLLIKDDNHYELLEDGMYVDEEDAILVIEEWE